jgi:carbamoyl-phosphate synthase large subunit
MKRSNTILLSCAGGPAAIGVIKSLRKIHFEGRIITIDSDPLSAGGLMSDKNYVVPLSESSDYWEVVTDIIDRENVNIILPTGDMDIVHFANNKTALQRLGISVFMSDIDVIRICQNKDEFYKKCKDKFSLPFTTTSYNDFDFDFEEKHKIVAKPKRGSGSRGIEVFKSYYDIPLNKKYNDYIFQSYLPGKEYTVDLLSDLKGNVLSCVVRERLQVKAGISVKGKIIRNETIEKMCKDLSLHLNLKGPVCIQLKEDEKGTPKFIEVNPRLGGGTYFTTLAGVNFVEMILQIVDGQSVDINTPNEITVVRYFNEIVV